MTRNTIAYPDKRALTERFECMDCGQVGAAADLRSHADLDGCRNFRVTATRASSTGEIIDQRIEVSQC